MTWIIWLIVVAAIFFVCSWLNIKKEKRLAQIPAVLAAFGFIVLVLILGISIPHDSLGVSAPITMGPGKIIYSTLNSPINNPNPDMSPGHIVCLYRFGCDDCDATYKELAKKFGDKAQWVSSRSEIGHELVEKYNIKSVPTALYFKKNVTGNQSDVIQAQLFIGDDEREPEVNYPSVEKILTAYEEGQ